MAKHVIFFGVLFIFFAQSFLGPSSIPALNTCHSLMSLPMCAYQIEFSQNKKLLLFIFDFNDFMCMNCLESFLSFCHSLPPHILEENTWGVLTVDTTTGRSEMKDAARIAKTKLRGFVAANRIKFPIFIDEFQIFQQYKKKGTAILLFDGTDSNLKEYIFPLNKAQIGEIQKIVSGF